MFIFNTSEEYWFSSWVVMRRKFIIANNNAKELIKDVITLRKENNELKEQINQSADTKERRRLTDALERRDRSQMIAEFNRKNNKGRNYKRKRKKHI